MQMLGADPGGQQMDDALSILKGIATTGDPTDVSALFESLQPIEDRARREGVAETRGPVSGLGQRFGSAQGNREMDFVGQLLESQAARREQTAFGAQEAAAGRRSAGANALMQALQGNVGLANQRSNALMNVLNQYQGQQMGGYGQLLGAEQGRNASNAQILSMMFGQPYQAGPGYTYGQAGQEISSMMSFLPFLMQLLGQGSPGGTTDVTAGDGSGVNNAWLMQFMQRLMEGGN